MGIFNFFSKNKDELNTIENISKKIFLTNNEETTKKRTEFDIRIELEKLYNSLSKLLFEAIKIEDFNAILEILSNTFLNKKKLIDEKGYNIIEYLLFNDKNAFFIDLYNQQYESIKDYFTNIPLLFTIILNRKNTELIEFFLKNTELSSSLKKENVTTCLFTSLQLKRKDLTDLIVNNFDDLLDSRNIEASMIYSISHNQEKELKTLFSYSKLIEKFTEDNIEKMLAFSVLNQNVEALEIMVSNQHFIQNIEKSDINMAKSILQIGRDKGSQQIVNALNNTNAISYT